MWVNIIDLAWLFWGGTSVSFFFVFKKGILMSVLHMVPLFDGDERVEMQVMIYDLASFTCKRHNARIFIEDLRWVTMDRGWHCTIFQLPSGVAVCWLTCPRKTLSLYSMGWTRVHSFITMRHIKKTLFILSTCVSRMIRYDVLYLCRFTLLHQPFITYCIVHLHFMVSFCWHVCLLFSGYDIL